MTVPTVVKQHVLEASTIWWRRRRIVSGARTLFSTMIELDRSIDLHLEGIAEARQIGLELANVALAKSVRLSSIDVAADSFVALSAVALNGDATALHAHVTRAVRQPGGMEAASGLFLWFDSPTVSLAFRHCAQDNLPELRPVLLNVAHAQEWPGADDHTNDAQNHGDNITCEELHAIGNCARGDRLPAVLRTLQDAQRQNESERFFAAARAAVLLGDRRLSVEALHTIGTSSSSSASEATALLAAVLSPVPLQHYLQSLEQLSTKRVTCVAAAGWSGDATYIPWLIGQMRDSDEDVVRAAGEAFRLITGCSLEANKLTKEATSSDRSLLADYALPDEQELKRWWDEHASLYEPGKRYFLGRSLTIGWIKLILQHGEQAHRTMAALHLKLMQADSTFFPTNASASRQLALLSTLTGVSP